ncbi:hypothetical protein [Mucilaginibacter agri]|uniref:Uncharacterized protein n=1 Tax=Mucilaginibacter agri TaxID=2695265 RepID=A0A965ZID0_9SPHI|nr:hypothetical protein [Mucilaginibacter agri]NCD70246.1 hypothetical protein [Mucilaginibacter agri]
MDSNKRFIIRRTMSQERFEVLWKKRMEGECTLRELAEMDEIINRDPMVRQFVLKEMEDAELPPRNDEPNTSPPATPQLKTLGDKIKSFLKRLINFFMSDSEWVIS